MRTRKESVCAAPQRHATMMAAAELVIIFLSLNLVIATGNKAANDPKRSLGSAGRSTACIPGTSMRFECFNCTCDPNGMEVTCEPLDECVSSIRYFQKQSPTRRCIPNFRSPFHCTMCTCTENGMAASCKPQTDCYLKGMTGEQRCFPNLHTRLQCVTCKCSADGRTATCQSKKSCQFYLYEKDSGF